MNVVDGTLVQKDLIAGLTLESAASGKADEFYYLLVDKAATVGAIRRVFLYRATTTDGNILS
jgi:hypothetical protein